MNDLHMRYKINTPRIVHQTIDGETIIVDFDNGTYYSTDKAGAVIWNQIEKGIAVNEIIQTLAQQYNANGTDIASAVSVFLAELQSGSLISPVNMNESSGSTNLTFAPAIPATATPPVFEMPALHKYTDMQDLLLLDPIHEVDESGWPLKKEIAQE